LENPENRQLKTPIKSETLQSVTLRPEALALVIPQLPQIDDSPKERTNEEILRNGIAKEASPLRFPDARFRVRSCTVR